MPQCPPSSFSLYSFKRAADDMASLAQQLGCSSIILGGHDWGGAIVPRIALWYPSLVRAIFTVCTPYWAPNKDWISLENVVRRVPNFGYQLQFSGPDVEGRIRDEDSLRSFFNGLFGGRGPNREIAMTPEKGVLFENLDNIGPSPLCSPEEIEYYVKAYLAHDPPLHGPLNWYRTRRVNYEEELPLATDDKRRTIIDVPYLFVQANGDNVLTPEMSHGLERLVGEGKLTRAEVEAGHWALWQKPADCNKAIGDWLEAVVQEGRGGDSKL